MENLSIDEIINDEIKLTKAQIYEREYALKNPEKIKLWLHKSYTRRMNNPDNSLLS
jgi:hypothetical protein